MSSRPVLLPAAAPRAAFGEIVLNEARLAWRTPIGVVFGVGLPVLLVVIFGELPSFNHYQANLGGLTEFNVYVPILIGLAIAAVGLFSLPAALVSYREQGILRRLSTTPVPPSWVLAAQVVINLLLAVIALLIVTVVGVAAFGKIAPKNLAGFVLAFLLSAAAIFAIGLTIAARARTAGAAGALGFATFFPLMFFAGLWLPRAQMPTGLRHVSDYTPSAPRSRHSRTRSMARSRQPPPWRPTRSSSATWQRDTSNGSSPSDSLSQTGRKVARRRNATPRPPLPSSQVF